MIANILTIAGSDSGGGAGIQADLKTFAAFNTYGLSVITALTAQNTVGVHAIHAVPSEFVRAQIQSIHSDIRVDAIKIGMLANTALIETVAQELSHWSPRPFLVIDPVMVATSGDALLEPSAVQCLQTQLLPMADLITPNLAEASLLLGEPVKEASPTACKALLNIGCKAVLLKGGHSPSNTATDIYADTTGRIEHFSAERIHTNNTHGTGCTLSAAIAAASTQQNDITSAIAHAKRFVTHAIGAADTLSVGKGHGPLWHGVDVTETSRR